MERLCESCCTLRYWPIAVGLIALAGVAVALVVFVLDDEGSDAPEAAGRPASTAVVADPQRTVELTDRGTLPPAAGRSSPVAELKRLTPVAQAADPLLASSIPATELREPNDAAGSGGDTEDAFALLQTTTVNKGAAHFIAEPHVASNGDRMMVVWNWGAAFSSDGGQTFSFVNPATAFPADKGQFCCDQLVAYVPGHDLWIWFLQYSAPTGGEANIVRIAVARGDADFDARRFTPYDRSSRDFPDLGLEELELDFPNLGLTDSHLFVSINAWGSGRYRNTVVFRTPLDELAAGEPLSMRYLLSPLGTADFAPGAGDTMYFAQHVDTSTLRVTGWRDDADSPAAPTDVVHSAYRYEPPRGDDFTCRREGVAGGDPCRRSDDDLTSGWALEDEIGFSWNVARDPAQGFPYPFVHVVRIDRETMALKDEPAIWHPGHAYQYVAIARNSRGDVGGIALSSGGTRYQTCASLIRDDVSGEAWDARAVSTSDDDPDASESGDYLGLARATPDGNTWTAACMTMHGGGSSSDIEVRLFRFGRAKDAEE